jgi:hypothetical protein
VLRPTKTQGRLCYDNLFLIKIKLNLEFMVSCFPNERGKFKEMFGLLANALKAA